MEKDIVFSLYQKPQTVFSLKEIAMMFPKLSYNNLKRRLTYYTQTGKLKKLRKNVYSKIKYNRFEVPQKLYMPSYISLESVLEEKGIHVVSHLSRKIIVDGNQIIYRLVPEKVLFNRLDLKETDGYFIASKERAFTDAVYIYKDYYFDDLRLLDWDKIMALIKIYESKILEKRVESYYQRLISKST